MLPPAERRPSVRRGPWASFSAWFMGRETKHSAASDPIEHRNWRSYYGAYLKEFGREMLQDVEGRGVVLRRLDRVHISN